MRQIYMETTVYTEKPYRGVREWLQALSATGARLYSCSLRPVAYIEAGLQSAGIEAYFDGHMGTDPATGRVDKCDVIQYEMEQRGLKKSETILIGDTNFDRDAAKKAGIAFVGVTYGYSENPDDLAGADHVVDTVAQLQALTLRLAHEGDLDV